MSANGKFVFPRWINYLLPLLVLGALGSGPFAVVLWTYGASPDTLNLGYEPTQPVPYSHEIHVGQLGMDCRYCHTTVDKAAFAAIPPTQTCINCHAPGKDLQNNATNLTGVWQASDNLKPLWDSYLTGKPVQWVKVHDLPDYAYFNHEAHVNKGVSCVSCHGRVDKMPVVYQAENLSMGWCLECHRAPEKFLRPADKVFDLGWQPELPAEGEAFNPLYHRQPGETLEQAQLRIGRLVKDQYDIHSVTYMTSCSTCHR